MDLLVKTLELCHDYQIAPTKSKGQNFLINNDVFDQIVQAAIGGNNVLEVGPGLGFMTEKLAAKFKQVKAVELDIKLFQLLLTKTKTLTNLELINADILALPVDVFDGEDYQIVANLPYNITSFFLRKFLEDKARPSVMILMLQKEVCERIVSKRSSLLSLSIQFYGTPEILFNVAANNFYPIPKVASAVLKIITRKTLLLPETEHKLFFRLLKFGFAAKRKMLKNNLSVGLKMPVLEVEKNMVISGFDKMIRAEALDLKKWLKLFAVFKGFMI